MSGAIDPSTIVAQSAHVFSEAVDVEVMEALRRHFGEQTPMGLSIDARQGVVCLARCMVSMLVSFETDEAVELLRAMEQATLSERKKALADFKRSGRA